MEKTLPELQAWHNRLITDVRRSRQIDELGLTNNSPLVRNLRDCERQIKQKLQEAKQS
jgi:dsDNA-specific endonuclease/ATPase MutS2